MVTAITPVGPAFVYSTPVGKAGLPMMEWEGPDEGGTLRDHDDLAMYVISRDDVGQFRVVFFPAPGPECPWGDSVGAIDNAIASAERCASHVREIRVRHGNQDDA
jgi:hypothetical protein